MLLGMWSSFSFNVQVGNVVYAGNLYSILYREELNQMSDSKSWTQWVCIFI